MDRDRRLTGFLRGQTDRPTAPAGFELNNPWRVRILLLPTILKTKLTIKNSASRASSRFARATGLNCTYVVRRRMNKGMITLQKEYELLKIHHGTEFCRLHQFLSGHIFCFCQSAPSFDKHGRKWFKPLVKCYHQTTNICDPLEVLGSLSCRKLRIECLWSV